MAGDSSRAQALDRGHVWPLPVSAALSPESSQTIQQLLDTWHAHAHRHAVRDMPSLAALQIAKFDECLGKLSPEWPLALPYFNGPGIDVKHSLYKAAAITYQLGAMILQGHYRTSRLSCWRKTALSTTQMIVRKR